MKEKEDRRVEEKEVEERREEEKEVGEERKETPLCKLKILKKF